MNTASNPLFLDKTVNLTSYVLILTGPQLVVGKQYAVLITAFDPMNQVTFRNKGKSEVCLFRYVEGQKPFPSDTLDNPVKKRQP